MNQMLAMSMNNMVEYKHITKGDYMNKTLSKNEFDAYLILAMNMEDADKKKEIIKILENGKRDYYAEHKATQAKKQRTQTSIERRSIKTQGYWRQAI